MEVQTPDQPETGQLQEKTPEQQRIDLTLNTVRSKNELFGGRLGAEAKLPDGSSIFVFNKTTSDRAGRFSRVYGVDSTQGPISIGGGAGNTDSRDVDLERVTKSLKEDGRTWVRPVVDEPETQNGRLFIVETLKRWEESFDNSVQAVLGDLEAMKQIREQRIAVLDKALTAVSKPIDFDSPLGTQPVVPETQFGVARAVPEDAAAADRDSAVKDLDNGGLGHSQS